VTKEDKTWWDS